MEDIIKKINEEVSISFHDGSEHSKYENLKPLLEILKSVDDVDDNLETELNKLYVHLFHTVYDDYKFHNNVMDCLINKGMWFFSLKNPYNDTSKFLKLKQNNKYILNKEILKSDQNINDQDKQIQMTQGELELLFNEPIDGLSVKKRKKSKRKSKKRF